MTSRRGFFKLVAAAAVLGPALLFRKQPTPAPAPTTTPTIDFYQSDYGRVEVVYGKWQGGKTRRGYVIDDYSRQMQRALTDINRVVNENMWNGGKLHD